MRTQANARSADRGGPFYRRIVARLAGFEDGEIMRVAFFALLVGTLGVLYVDYRELTTADAALVGPVQPILPPVNPEAPGGMPHPEVTTDSKLLDAPLTIELAPGRVLKLTGTIDIGAGDRFAAEIAARGEYADTIDLDSPGGSVMDALQIGALIHEKGLATTVGAGALCASSCPLVLAGGKTRTADPKASVGVHQIYAAAIAADPTSLAQAAGVAMSEAQRKTGDILTYLARTGVDPALWTHALATPPDQLYYLSAKEMKALKLTTQ